MTPEERRALALQSLSGCHILGHRRSKPLRDLTPRHEKQNHAGQIWRQCKKKCAYSSESKARSVAADALAKRGVALRAYRCHYCKRWHLTKSKIDET